MRHRGGSTVKGGEGGQGGVGKLPGMGAAAAAPPPLGRHPAGQPPRLMGLSCSALQSGLVLTRCWARHCSLQKQSRRLLLLPGRAWLAGSFGVMGKQRSNARVAKNIDCRHRPLRCRRLGPPMALHRLSESLGQDPLSRTLWGKICGSVARACPPLQAWYQVHCTWQLAIARVRTTAPRAAAACALHEPPRTAGRYRVPTHQHSADEHTRYNGCTASLVGIRCRSLLPRSAADRRCPASDWWSQVAVPAGAPWVAADALRLAVCCSQVLQVRHTDATVERGAAAQAAIRKWPICVGRTTACAGRPCRRRLHHWACAAFRIHLRFLRPQLVFKACYSRAALLHRSPGGP